LDPAGQPFQQTAAITLAKTDHLIFICGRYEGVDARIWNYIDEAWSLGDFVITGGELAGLVMADAIARMRPGVLGNAESIQTESHMGNLLEHHQYTRPIEYDNWQVPEVLLSGHHQKIQQARHTDAQARTQRLRPDLIPSTNPSAAHECLTPVRKGQS
jgi:tRNA (guanine37-N1)-methyltransferase